jgi:hypothetical protein
MERRGWSLTHTRGAVRRLGYLAGFLLASSLVLMGCGNGGSSRMTGPSSSETVALHPTNGPGSVVTLPAPAVTADAAAVCEQVTLSWLPTTVAGHTSTSYHVIVERVGTGATVYGNNNLSGTSLVLTTSTTLVAGQVLALVPGVAYRAKVKAKSVENGVRDSAWSAWVTFTLTACAKTCSPARWLPPVTHNPTVKQPSTLPIKFCPSTDLGPTAAGTLSGPEGSVPITFRRAGDGLYIYHFRSRDWDPGDYTVSVTGAPDLGTETFTVVAKTGGKPAGTGKPASAGSQGQGHGAGHGKP